MGEAKRRKLARDATPEENIVGQPGPVQPAVAARVRAVMDVLAQAFPGYGVTLFLNEKAAPDGRLPRFNYASTEHREDMLAVLKAFALRNADLAKQERINDPAATEVRQ